MGTVGAQRQYSGTAGRIENCQVAVYLTYATAVGDAFIDLALYLPAHGPRIPTGGPRPGARRGRVRHQTRVGERLIFTALDAGVRARWVTGDEVYGGDPNLRTAIESRSMSYVLAIACSHRLTTATGRVRADKLAATLPKRACQPPSADDGAKGPRIYDWVAWIDIEPDDGKTVAGQRWLLIRRAGYSGDLQVASHSPFRRWNL